MLSPRGSNLKVTMPGIGPLKTSHFSSDQSESYSSSSEEFFNNIENKMTSVKPVWKKDTEERDKNKRNSDSGFTLITKQRATEDKASGNPRPLLDNNTDTPTTHMHKPVTQTITPAMQSSAHEEETDIYKREAIRTAITSSNVDRNNVTSSDQGQAGGNTIHRDFSICLVYNCSNCFFI